MTKLGLPIGLHNIRKIIKDAGYCYGKAKRVLTSSDPNYKDKLKEITRILQNLPRLGNLWVTASVTGYRRLWSLD